MKYKKLFLGIVLFLPLSAFASSEYGDYVYQGGAANRRLANAAHRNQLSMNELFKAARSEVPCPAAALALDAKVNRTGGTSPIGNGNSRTASDRAAGYAGTIN